MNFIKLLGAILALGCLCLGLKAQTKIKKQVQHKSIIKLNYRGCWSGADNALTYMLIKGNTVEDTRSRKLFHFTEISKNLKTKTVVLKLKEETPSRQLFEIQFISNNEIMIGMPMFRDTCKLLPGPHSGRRQ